jgi:hypothetical protein
MHMNAVPCKWSRDAGAGHEGVLPSFAGNGERKTQRRLEQNREAARKSRMRRKAYVQKLEEEVSPMYCGSTGVCQL